MSRKRSPVVRVNDDLEPLIKEYAEEREVTFAKAVGLLLRSALHDERRTKDDIIPFDLMTFPEYFEAELWYEFNLEHMEELRVKYNQIQAEIERKDIEENEKEYHKNLNEIRKLFPDYREWHDVFQ